MYSPVSPITRIHESRSQGIEIGIAALTNTSSDSLTKCLLSIPATLGSADLEAVVPQRAMLSARDKPVIPLTGN